MNNRQRARVRQRVREREASPAALAKMLYPEMVKVMSRALKAGGCRSLRYLWYLSGANTPRFDASSFYEREVNIPQIRPGLYDVSKSSAASRK